MTTSYVSAEIGNIVELVSEFPLHGDLVLHRGTKLLVQHVTEDGSLLLHPTDGDAITKCKASFGGDQVTFLGNPNNVDSEHYLHTLNITVVD